MTGRPWHRREPATFRELERAVQQAYPGLYFEERGEQLLFSGDFQLEDGGRVIDVYEIEVEIPHGGPKTDLPVVREVGGRIPRTRDRHVNPDGSACLMVPDAFWFRHPDGLGFLEFLRGPVTGYFLGQSIVEGGGEWPFGERAHGLSGLIEFYASLIGSADPVRIHAFLADASARKLRAHGPCPCGSGHFVLACHGATIRKLRRIPRPVLLGAAAMVRSILPATTVTR